MAYMGDRMKEVSTYEGLTVLAGLLGFVLSPAHINLIGTAAALIYGLIKTFKKEKK